MNRDTLALRLIDSLYHCACNPGLWDQFAEELSLGVGQAAVSLAIRRPGAPAGWDFFGGPAEQALVPALLERYPDSIHIAVERAEAFRKGFYSLGEAFHGVDLRDFEPFREWAESRGVAPTWPLAHAVVIDDEILAWIAVQPFTAADFDSDRAVALGAALVPHFERALSIHTELSARHQKRRALEEVLDRLQTGVILLDGRGRVMLSNVSAQRMLALDDGVTVRGGRLRAVPGADEALKQKVDEAIEAASRGDFGLMGQLTIKSRSGRTPFLIGVAPLHRGVPGSPLRDAVAFALVSNSDATSTASVKVIEAIYGLTSAEAAIVHGLIGGKSLEEVAAKRSVKVSTARSQLSEVFSKTGTRRQPELIRLVLAGVAPLRPPVESESDPKT
jgi:DNA-binding CsgD family transcriptional regulator